MWFLVCYCFFLFFKQKTAYEMRISDWSSDVGSSDLVVGLAVWAGQLATGGALFLTSLVSSAVIIATAPTLKQSHPARVTLSHAIAMISGIGMRAVLPMSPYAVALSVVVEIGRASCRERGCQ